MNTAFFPSTAEMMSYASVNKKPSYLFVIHVPWSKPAHFLNPLVCSLIVPVIIPPFINFSTKYLMMCNVYTDVGGIK